MQSFLTVSRGTMKQEGSKRRPAPDVDSAPASSVKKIRETEDEFTAMLRESRLERERVTAATAAALVTHGGGKSPRQSASRTEIAKKAALVEQQAERSK